MSDLGMGVMISMLFGSRGGEHLKEVKGKTIKALRLDTEDRGAEDALVFEFEDGSAIKIYDGGQSCCESRYMHTDDDLPYFVGSKLMDAELRASGDVVEEEHGWMYKESEFLIITTSLGQFTIVNYNEHNGYYGGFWIMIAKVSDPTEEKDDDLGTVLHKDSEHSSTEVEGPKH